MGKVARYKKGIGAWISSEKGQRFFNFAYSIGAAVVIWGALFKILHLPGGNMLLSLGMGTEVLMFLLTAFDRPPREYKWEEVFPALDTHDEADRPQMGGSGSGGTVIVGGGTPASGTVVIGDGSAASGTVVIGDGSGGGTATPVTAAPATGAAAFPVIPECPDMTDVAAATRAYLEQMKAIAEEMQHLQETTAALNGVSDVLLESYRAITQHSAEISDSATGYVEQMQSLNRNISGLNTIYEIQLRSVSSQLDAIDRVNRGIKDIRDMYEKSAEQSTRYCEETEKMARYMQQLNNVYEKMITAMTINMYRPMMAPDTNPPASDGTTPDQD